MAKMVTATDVVERVIKLVQGDQPSVEFERRAWLFLQDTYQQLANMLLDCFRVSSSLTLDSCTVTTDITWANFGQPIRVYTLDSSTGNRTHIPVVDDYTWDESVTTSSAGSASMCRIYGIDSDKYRQLQISPPLTSQGTLYIDYYASPKALYEYTAGNATTSAGGTGVVGSATSFTTYVSAGDYFRVDTDAAVNGLSYWYKIALSSTATQITLTSAYPSLQSQVNYTISNIVDLPDNGISCLVYLTAAEMFMVDGNEKMSEYYQNKGMALLSALKKSYTDEVDEYSFTNAYMTNREFE